MLELGLTEAELWIGEMRGVVVGNARLLVVRNEQSLCVYRDRCPHLGHPLSEGTLEDGVITCRLHRHTFEAESGAGVNPRRAALQRVECRVREGRIFVEVEP
ncbi:MAG TPA: Rieske 2Fe-2S domain-containing protein [Polyangiaceae bacterium]|nr:Rieske 2Fe-2S domain-containing protein [Polyangiaceae bacterium]